jgi:hypothetical protein
MKTKPGVKLRPVKIIPVTFRRDNLQDILKNFGLTEVHTLDHLDKRADIVHDMNFPLH